MSFFVRAADADPAITGAVTTAVGVPLVSVPPGFTGTLRISPGLPLQSAVHYRMKERDSTGMNVGAQMPPIGTEEPDLSGVTVVEGWITSLQ
jgi:hypothetical protein